MVPKMWFSTIFGSIKNHFGLVFFNLFKSFKKGVLYWTFWNGSRKFNEPKRFSIEPKYPKVTPEQRIAMQYNGQRWTNFKSQVQGVKWQNQTEQRAFSNLFNGTAKISTSITKSWSEVSPLLIANIPTDD